MFDLRRLIRQYWFFAAVIILTIAKLLLISGQELRPNLSGYDDLHFLSVAEKLKTSCWLGSYDQQTLVDGMFFPLWIAVTSSAGMPLLFSQHVLYVIACAVMVTALRPSLQTSGTRLFLYAFLLFNPISYAVPYTTQVTRESVYCSLTLLVVACAAGLMLRIEWPVKKICQWSIALGLLLSSFWLTREEGVWITPLLVIMLGSAMVFLWRKKPVQWSKMLILGALPIIILVVCVGTVAGINKIRYGIFATVELKNSNFIDAYGALSRVKSSSWKQYYPVPKDVREKIYAVSPAFREIEPFLDGSLGERWMAYGCNQAGLCDDIGGGWFLSAFRESVTAAGHHSSGTAAMAYYRRLASEINAACDSHLLDCLPPRSTMMPVWHSEYNKQFLDTILLAASNITGLSGFTVQPEPRIMPTDKLDYFRAMTRERISSPSTGLSISGWVVDLQGLALRFSIINKNGAKADSAVEREFSPGLYEFFLKRGQDIPSARRAGFNIITSCSSDCSLLIESDKGISKNIPLDGTIENSLDNSLALHLNFVKAVPIYPTISTSVERTKLLLLDKVGKFYQRIMPALAILSLAGYFLVTYFVLQRRLAPERWLIATSLFISIAGRIVLLSIINVSLYPSIHIRYLSPVYPLLLLFEFLAVTDCLVLVRTRFISTSYKDSFLK
ncbi:MAG: hypothetical protein ACLQF0_14880 [Dissulfurispiraceae bacterium]